MIQKGFIASMIALAAIFAGCGESDTDAPRVVETFPPSGSRDVDPSINEISVTFNEEIDGSELVVGVYERKRIPGDDRGTLLYG